MCGKRKRLKPFPLSTGMGDHPGRVARPMSSSDVGLGVEVDCGKLDQLLLSQPMPPAVLDPSCAESAVVPPASCYQLQRPLGRCMSLCLVPWGGILWEEL